MPLHEFTALLLLATAMSFTPGPNTTLSTALAANTGFRHSLPFVLSVPLGWSALLVLSAAGLGSLIAGIPALRGTVKVLGIGYMFWMAFRLSRSGQINSAASAQLRISFSQGFLLQFVNIKAWLLALTIVAGWVAGHGDWLTRIAIVLPVMSFYALSSNLLYACIGAVLRQWLSHGRRLLFFNRSMALLLTATAIWMLRA